MRFIDYSARALRETKQQTHKRMTVELIETFVELAKERSPYLTGNNRSTITYSTPGVLHWRVFTTSGYGAWLELGTKRMGARPYFAPGFQIAHAEFMAKGGRWV